MYLKSLAISAPLCCHWQYASSTPLSEWLLKHWWEPLQSILTFYVVVVKTVVRVSILIALGLLNLNIFLVGLVVLLVVVEQS